MTTNPRIKKSLILPLIGIGIGIFAFAGCKNGMSSFKTTPSGLEYRIVEDKPGDTARPGDYMKLTMRTVVHDSTLLDTYKEGVGYRWLPLQESMGQKYDIMEGLARLSKGDSAEFRVPADSVMNPMNRPSFVEAGDMFHVYIKVLDIKDKEGYEDAIAQENKVQNEKDAKKISQYVDSVGANPKVTDDGVNVIVHQGGNGPAAKEGQTVSIMYTGKTLDGTVFDSNMDTTFHHTDPLTFSLGQGMMIKGMESGMEMLNKGAKATLVIPSSLAYGRDGRPPVIQPNAVLLFDVEVNDISGEPNPSTPQGN